MSEIPMCEAVLEFDVTFDVMCQLHLGHHGRHRADTWGNGNTPATVEWWTQAEAKP